MNAVLQTSLVVRRGSFVLDAALRLEQGEVLALLGPNGAGKSTLLGALAGLIRPESGSVTVSGHVLTSRSMSGSREVRVPPERRGIGMLGQHALLFPHLSAIENVAFGREAQGVRRKDALRDAAGWLESVGLAGYERRKPAALSGGQQQRVAIARALAARPRVLLLDEPMAALDVQTASLIRELLRERLADSGVATIVVTHDVLDAVVLADRVAILQDGRVVDDGPTRRVLGEPRTPFIAALAGLNLLSGRIEGEQLLLPDGRRLSGTIRRGRHTGPGSATFRPSAVRVHATRPDAAIANGWTTAVAALEPTLGGIRMRTEDGVAADIPASDVVALELRPGRPVWLSVEPAEVTIHE